MFGINTKKLQKEDPEKVKAFLKDLCECQELPESARNAAKNLLKRFEAGQNIKSGIKSEVKALISDLKKSDELPQ